MFNNPYINQYNPQQSIDRINAQMAELEQMKQKLQQPVQPITQNFQLAPNNNGKIRYANTIDEVNKEPVQEETAFFSKDLSVVWIKNVSGNIRIFEMKETTFKDSKDMLIDALMLQIEDLKKGNKNAKSNIINDDESTPAKKSSNVSSNKSIKTE